MTIACYKPLIRIEDLHRYEKAKDGHLYHPARILSTEQLEQAGLGEYTDYKVQLIPCQNCIGCRLDNSRNWANRGYLESLYSEHNYFVTLTYDEDHLPVENEVVTTDGIIYENDGSWKGILVPKHVETFLNSIRKIFEREYDHTGIRFICAGEYGENTRRPHYHLILFNCPFPLDTFYNPRLKWKKYYYYQNTILERAWNKGISNICEANWQNIAYVSRYITKKMNGEESEDFYAIQGEIKEFFRCSTKPGIGYQYFEDHWKEIYKTDSVLIKVGSNSRQEKPPKYYDDLLKKKDPDLYEEIRIKRQKQAENGIKRKLENTSLTWWQQLQVELRTKEQKTRSLARSNLDEDMGH